MQKMVSLLLVTVMVAAVTVPYAEAVKCYQCAGYDPNIPSNTVTNTKYCQQSNFDKTKLRVVTSDLCGSEIRELNGQKATIRDAYKVITRGTTSMHYKGYYCNTDYCNVMDPASAGHTSLLSLPLLLLSLVAALPRCLA